MMSRVFAVKLVNSDILYSARQIRGQRCGFKSQSKQCFFFQFFTRYKVDGSSWSKQLPTIILFENGKEKMRRPYVDYKGTVQKFFFTEVLLSIFQEM